MSAAGLPARARLACVCVAILLSRVALKITNGVRLYSFGERSEFINTALHVGSPFVLVKRSALAFPFCDDRAKSIMIRTRFSVPLIVQRNGSLNCLIQYIMSKKATLHESYVPRNMRLNGVGFFSDAIPSVAVHELTENVPVLSRSGTVLFEKPVVVESPAHEALSKFKYEDFRLESLLSAGVKLEEVEFNLNSRSQGSDLVQRALELGLLSEYFSQSQPSLSENSVEPSNSDVQ